MEDKRQKQAAGSGNESFEEMVKRYQAELARYHTKSSRTSAGGMPSSSPQRSMESVSMAFPGRLEEQMPVDGMDVQSQQRMPEPSVSESMQASSDLSIVSAPAETYESANTEPMSASSSPEGPLLDRPAPSDHPDALQPITDDPWPLPQYEPEREDASDNLPAAPEVPQVVELPPQEDDPSAPQSLHAVDELETTASAETAVMNAAATGTTGKSMDAAVYDDIGYLTVEVFTARRAMPIPFAFVTVTQKRDGQTVMTKMLETNISGSTPTIALPAPNRALSETPGNGIPYAIYNIRVDSPGYYVVDKVGTQVFAGTNAIQSVEMVPLPERGEITATQVYNIPPNQLIDS